MISLQYTTKKISTKALQALKNSTVRQINDCEFALDCDQQLPRKDYDSFKAVVEACKGMWNGKTHLFPYDPSAVLAEVCNTGLVPVNNPYSLFETPEDGISDLFVELGIGDYSGGEGFNFLEPSAGTGRIASAIRKRFPQASIDVCEIDPFNQEILKQQEFNLIGDDFLKLQTDQQYDYILMNPPFKGTEYINHILKAWSLLAPHGKLVSVAPSGFLFGSTKKIESFRNLVAEYGDWGGFLHQFADTPIKCSVIILEKLSDSRLTELWSDTNGYSSWFQYNTELYLDNEREYHDGMDRISKLPDEQWQGEAEKLCNSVASKLIREGVCFLWDKRIKAVVYQSCLDDIQERAEYDRRSAEAEVVAEPQYNFEPHLTGRQGDLFEPQLLQGSLL